MCIFTGTDFTKRAGRIEFWYQVASEASAMAPFLALAGVLVCQSLVGSKIDSRLVLDFGFPPQKINLAERVANKKVILVGLPGAFTPT